MISTKPLQVHFRLSHAPGWKLGDECVYCQACGLRGIAPPTGDVER